MLLHFVCSCQDGVETRIQYFEGSEDIKEWQSYMQKVPHGTWKKYYANHQLLESREYRHGKKIGKLIRYWPNGHKQMEYHFEDDEYHGEAREWSEAGVLTRWMHYEKGHEEGLQQYYNDEGKLKSNYVIRNGRRYGLLGTKHCINIKDSFDIR